MRLARVEPSVVTVFLAALVTALATGLGALPLIFVRSAGRTVLGASNALACQGVMLGCQCRASPGRESIAAPGEPAFGVALGIGFVLASQRYLSHDHAHALGSLRGEDARQALLIVGVMTVHSAAEGDRRRRRVRRGGSTLGPADHGGDRRFTTSPKGSRSALSSSPRGTSVRSAAGLEHLLESAAATPRRPCVPLRQRVLVESFRSDSGSPPARWSGWWSGNYCPTR